MLYLCTFSFLSFLALSHFLRTGLNVEFRRLWLKGAARCSKVWLPLGECCFPKGVINFARIFCGMFLFQSWLCYNCPSSPEHPTLAEDGDGLHSSLESALLLLFLPLQEEELPWEHGNPCPIVCPFPLKIAFLGPICEQILLQDNFHICQPILREKKSCLWVSFSEERGCY